MHTGKIILCLKDENIKNLNDCEISYIVLMELKSKHKDKQNLITMFLTRCFGAPTYNKQ